MTHLHRRTTPLVIAFVLLVTTPDSDRLNAQAPAASRKPLQFEVASVKPTLSPAAHSVTRTRAAGSSSSPPAAQHRSVFRSRGWWRGEQR